MTVTSNNGTIATITKDGSVAGGTSLTFTNVTSTSVGTIFVQGRGLGATTLTVQAAGYNDGTSNVTVDPSGFILNVSNFTTNTFAANTTLRVDAARAQSDDAELPAVAGAAGRTDGERRGDELRYQRRHDRRQSGGVQRRRHLELQRRRSIRRRPATTTISITTPAGFPTPNNLQSVTGHTSPRRTSRSANATVGRDLQDVVSISLGADAAEPGDGDGDEQQRRHRDDHEGRHRGRRDEPDVHERDDARPSGTIFVQGRGLGSTTLTVQAAGYNDGTSNITVDPSGFILNMGDFNTNTFAANTTLRVDAARLNPTTLNYVQSQALRGGLTVNVAVTSSEHQRRHHRRQSRRCSTPATR